MSIRPFSMKMIALVSSAVLVTGAAALAQMQQPGGSMPAPGGAQPQGGTMPGPSPNMQGSGAPDTSLQTMQDKNFLKDALEGGMVEVQLGQLAAQKGSSEDVKSFGQKMVDDHTQMGNAISQVAQGVGVTPPSGLSKKDKEMVAKLGQLSGSQFDDAYIRAMVKDHKKDDDAFKTEAQNAAIPAVKQAAAQGEHVIAGHLQMIEQIAQAHDSKGGKSSSAGLQ
jgi:putative membrane protein